MQLLFNIFSLLDFNMYFQLGEITITKKIWC